jgi:hypothetical protein
MKKRGSPSRKVIPAGVFDFLQTCETCPSGVAVEDCGEQRDLIDWSQFDRSARCGQWIVRAAIARKILYE